MLWINLKIAFRNLRKNKLYAVINIGGLAVGLAIYLFGFLLVEYESTHDAFFANSDRIYTVNSVLSPSFGSVAARNTTFSALKPVIDADLNDVEASARTMRQEYVVSLQERAFYETVTFADPELLRIFDFTYIQGGADALDNPGGIVLTEATAIKYFGHSDVLGETVSLNNEHEFGVSAVISIPQNSHFNSWFSGQLNIVASFERLGSISNFPYEGVWNMQRDGDVTYVLLPPSLDQEWLQLQLNGIYDRVIAERQLNTISGFAASPLQRTNLVLWEMLAVPVPEIIKLLSLLVLFTACVNYTNLAVAQSMGRSREVGMRKTVGASQTQLLWQFISESLLTAALALICALALLELVIPIFNNLTNKVLRLDYTNALPWLTSTTLAVGILAGIYPAWIITRANAAEALRDTARKGKKGAKTRALMVGLQFAISAFMLAVVAIMFAQNKSIEEASYIFPRSEIYTLSQLGAVNDQLDILQRELEAISGVASVAYSSQVPYEEIDVSISLLSIPGDEASLIRSNQLRISPEFFTTYNIPLLAGRNLDRDRADDEFRPGESKITNVVVNELALQMLGIGSPEEALNQSIFPPNGNNEFVIVGVVPTQNIHGLMSSNKPWIFFWNTNAQWIDMASIRVGGENFQQVVEDIEAAWKRVIPNRPIRGAFLDDFFNEIFSIMTIMNAAIAGFALVAILLAMIGLFGLAVFYSSQRTKEIGVRKALGASSKQITRLLIWQFSKPVLWALVLALPAAFFASNLYLNIFADRIDSSLWILVLAGIASVLLSWLTVAGQAYSVARKNPITALRYE